MQFGTCTVACLLVSMGLSTVGAQFSIPGQHISFKNLQSARANVSAANGRVTSSILRLEGRPLVEDVFVLRSLGHFDRERIPERVVHAKGSSFYGMFRVTNADISRFTKASVFGAVGMQTRVVARFSTSLGERGSADTLLGEVRGLGVKFYTSEGNYDQLCINMPIFFINDPQLFPQLTHAQKRHPQSDFHSGNNLWDFLSLRPEALNMVTLLYSDHGLPDGYKHMSAFTVNAFRLTNADNQHSYAKFVWLPQQGIRNLNLSRALHLAGQDPDYARRDLFTSIKKKHFPSWTLFAQVITLEEVHSDFTYDPFDATKLWPFDKYPLVEVGVMTLTRNVENAFAENEQLALNPANLVPGIEPSPDPLLRGRLFAYRDTQFHRLGANHVFIPVNREPKRILSERDGFIRSDDNLGSSPNYSPNSHFLARQEGLSGLVAHPFSYSIDDVQMNFRTDTLEQQYLHARETYHSLTDVERDHLHHNLAYALTQVSSESILRRVLVHLSNISPLYANSVAAELNLHL